MRKGRHNRNNKGKRGKPRDRESMKKRANYDSNVNVILPVNLQANLPQSFFAKKEKIVEIKESEKKSVEVEPPSSWGVGGDDGGDELMDQNEEDFFSNFREDLEEPEEEKEDDQPQILKRPNENPDHSSKDEGSIKEIFDDIRGKSNQDEPPKRDRNQPEKDLPTSRYGDQRNRGRGDPNDNRRKGDRGGDARRGGRKNRREDNEKGGEQQFFGYKREGGNRRGNRDQRTGEYERYNKNDSRNRRSSGGGYRRKDDRKGRSGSDRYNNDEESGGFEKYRKGGKKDRYERDDPKRRGGSDNMDAEERKRKEIEERDRALEGLGTDGGSRKRKKKGRRTTRDPEFDRRSGKREDGRRSKSPSSLDRDGRRGRGRDRQGGQGGGDDTREFTGSGSRSRHQSGSRTNRGSARPEPERDDRYIDKGDPPDPKFTRDIFGSANKKSSSSSGKYRDNKYDREDRPRKKSRRESDRDRKEDRKSSKRRSKSSSESKSRSSKTSKESYRDDRLDKREDDRKSSKERKRKSKKGEKSKDSSKKDTKKDSSKRDKNPDESSRSSSKGRKKRKDTSKRGQKGGSTSITAGEDALGEQKQKHIQVFLDQFYYVSSTPNDKEEEKGGEKLRPGVIMRPVSVAQIRNFGGPKKFGPKLFQLIPVDTERLEKILEQESNNINDVPPKRIVPHKKEILITGKEAPKPPPAASPLPKPDVPAPVEMQFDPNEPNNTLFKNRVPIVTGPVPGTIPPKGKIGSKGAATTTASNLIKTGGPPFSNLNLPRDGTSGNFGIGRQPAPPGGTDVQLRSGPPNQEMFNRPFNHPHGARGNQPPFGIPPNFNPNFGPGPGPSRGMGGQMMGGRGSGPPMNMGQKSNEHHGGRGVFSGGNNRNFGPPPNLKFGGNTGSGRGGGNFGHRGPFNDPSDMRGGDPRHMDGRGGSSSRIENPMYSGPDNLDIGGRSGSGFFKPPNSGQFSRYGNQYRNQPNLNRPNDRNEGPRRGEPSGGRGRGRGGRGRPGGPGRNQGGSGPGGMRPTNYGGNPQFGGGRRSGAGAGMMFLGEAPSDFPAGPGTASMSSGGRTKVWDNRPSDRFGFGNRRGGGRGGGRGAVRGGGRGSVGRRREGGPDLFTRPVPGLNANAPAFQSKFKPHGPRGAQFPVRKGPIIPDPNDKRKGPMDGKSKIPPSKAPQGQQQPLMNKPKVGPLQPAQLPGPNMGPSVQAKPQQQPLPLIEPNKEVKKEMNTEMAPSEETTQSLPKKNVPTSSKPQGENAENVGGATVIYTDARKTKF